PRSPEMVVAMLAVLAAGAAYLPLSRELPPDRLSYMLADAGVAAVLAAGGLPARVALAGAVRRWEGASLAAGRGAAGPPEPPPPPPAPAVPPPVPAACRAYVIYTSGSTGRPKGVELTHAGVVNLVRWHRRAYGLADAPAAARAAQVAELSFDAAVWELWPYLA